MNLENYLYNKILKIIQDWHEDDIYAISFFVYSNEANVYNGINNFPEFSIGYNTENYYNSTDKSVEEKWNFAYWQQEMFEIISADEDNDGAKYLLDWYKENGINNIGFEDESCMYDENMNYIGKGPVGYYELLCAASNVARLLQSNNVIKNKFGLIPIIVHDLEYPWYVEEATLNANPNGQADEFLNALKNYFMDA